MAKMKPVIVPVKAHVQLSFIEPPALGDGYSRGYDDGYEVGHVDGYDTGYPKGFDAGYAACEAEFTSGTL